MFTEEDWIMEEEEFFNSLQEIEVWGDNDEEFLDEWEEIDWEGVAYDEELNFNKE